MSKHAAYPPSSLERMEVCPGFRNRSGNKTEASMKGDRIHKALEIDKIETLAEEERPIAQMCRDYIDGVIAERLPVRPDADYRELTVPVALHAGVDTFGTFDRLLIYGSEGFMFDYKSGYRAITDAEHNVQAWSYVIGVFDKFIELEKVTFTFLVPVRDEVLSYTFSRSQVPDMKLRLNTIIRCAMEIDWTNPSTVPESKLNPQPETCEYCQFQTECPALARKALVIGARIADGLPIPDSLVIDKNKPQEIQHFLRLAPLLESIAASWKAEALRLNLEEGLEIPGFNRVTRRTDRAVTSVVGAWEAVQKKVTLNQFLSVCAGISIPKLEAFFKEKAPAKGKAKAVRNMECNLRDAGVWADQGEIYYLKESKA